MPKNQILLNLTSISRGSRTENQGSRKKQNFYCLHEWPQLIKIAQQIILYVNKYWR